MKNAKILFVDDEEVLRKLGRRLLAGTYDVSFASGMAEALEIIAGQSLDLLITDWRLQDGEGSAVIGAFGRKFPGAPCILITGFLDTEEFLRASAGFQFAARFQKPFNIMEFQEAVRRALLEADPGKAL